MTTGPQTSPQRQSRGNFTCVLRNRGCQSNDLKAKRPRAGRKVSSLAAFRLALHRPSFRTDPSIPTGPRSYMDEMGHLDAEVDARPGGGVGLQRSLSEQNAHWAQDARQVRSGANRGLPIPLNGRLRRRRTPWSSLFPVGVMTADDLLRQLQAR